MSPVRPARSLFIKWLLLNALAVTFLVSLGVEYHTRVHGASLIAVPTIIFVAAYGSFLGGRISWQAGKIQEYISAPAYTRARLLHEARYLTFWAWVCQILGILATVVGFYLLLSGEHDTAALGDRIQAGGGVALIGTFVGIFASLVLSLQQRMIEHDLDDD